MNAIVHSSAGLTHLIAASMALVFGTWVLVIRKGTRFHRLPGYCYAFSMLVLNATSGLNYSTKFST